MTNTKKNEGYRKALYLDPSGKNKSVGYGINADDPSNKDLLPEDVRTGKRQITDKEANDSYNKKMAQSIEESKAYVGKEYDGLNPEAQSIIHDMHYNMGQPTMNKFKGLQKASKAHDYGRMADEIQYTNADKKDKETPYYQKTKGRAKEHVKTLRDLADKKSLENETIKQIKEKQK